MGDALVRLVRADQRLAGLETPVRVELHERAVWYSVGSSYTPISGRLEAERWWEPLKRSRAREIHELLVARLLAAVDAGAEGV